MPASTLIAQHNDAYRTEHLIPQESLIAPEKHTQKLNATMMRCSTTSSSSPQSEDDNDNTSDSLSTEAPSAQSCDSSVTMSFYSSSQDHGVSSVPVTLDRIFRDNLSVEILMLYEELLPSRESYERRKQLICKIERLLNDEWPNRDIRVHLFGSSANELGTTHSDVDLCITTPWNGLRNVRTLARLFGRCGMQHVVCVPRAKVPIVRLFDPETQLACDINVNNTLALQNTKMIKTYVALDPRVRPLIMLIKYWTKQRRLNDAANGGTLSTYTWTCMVINFLQMREPPVLPILHQLSGDKDDNSFSTDVDILEGFGIANEESLGSLLYAFFRRYAMEFDYEEQVVSVRHGQYLSKQEKGWNTGRNKQSFCVEEPFNVTRNLGNSADQESVRGLVVEFQRACFLLAEHASLDIVCETYTPTADEPRSPLAPTSNTVPSPQPAALVMSPPTSARRMSNTASRSVHPMDGSQESIVFTTSTSHIPQTQAMYDIRYPHVPTRPRFNLPTITNPPTRTATTTTAPHLSSYSPKLSNATAVRQSSIPMICNAPLGNSSPVAITIALPPPSSASYAVSSRQMKSAVVVSSTAPSPTPQQDSPTVDSILARYCVNQDARRRSSASSNHRHYHNNNTGRRVSSTNARRTSTTMTNGNQSVDWPTISPTSSTGQQQEQQQQQQQQQSHHRRRRWSTVKKSGPDDPPRKTMADVVKHTTRNGSANTNSRYHKQKKSETTAPSGQAPATTNGHGRSRRRHNSNNNKNHHGQGNQ